MALMTSDWSMWAGRGSWTRMLLLAGVCGDVLLEGLYPQLPALLVLHVHVDQRGGVVSHHNYCQTRFDTLCLQNVDTFPQIRVDRLGYLFAEYQVCSHDSHNLDQPYNSICTRTGAFSRATVRAYDV